MKKEGQSAGQVCSGSLLIAARSWEMGPYSTHDRRLNMLHSTTKWFENSESNTKGEGKKTENDDVDSAELREPAMSVLWCGTEGIKGGEWPGTREWKWFK